MKLIDFYWRQKKLQHLLNKYPKVIFDLLATIFNPDVEQSSNVCVDDFNKIIQMLLENSPEIKNDPRYLKN
ncbi:hypothetical protein [Methylocucumis oryzae]|uniref:Uncharacterized protein n=1 Tax=Methylocucumis oryzae TaxID=1632867 RepID=A0A0F3IG66_9GAMM|nr:hypothetical protein [Methylocucumis oryzae]KJV05790.1 hypothetical protein VZ94_15615 [Methylocucumis oryzae]